MLARLFGVMLGVCMMTMRYVGMVARLFVISRGVMLGGGAMVFRGVLVVVGGFQVMLFTFFRHGALFLRLRDLGLRIPSSCESTITGL
jgi:hypothetical protein